MNDVNNFLLCIFPIFQTFDLLVQTSPSKMTKRLKGPKVQNTATHSPSIHTTDSSSVVIHTDTSLISFVLKRPGRCPAKACGFEISVRLLCSIQECDRSPTVRVHVVRLLNQDSSGSSHSTQPFGPLSGSCLLHPTYVLGNH